MRAHEIIDNYFDLTQIEPETYNEIVTALERQDVETNSETTRSAFLQAMYGHDSEREDLELDLLRHERAKLRAEIDRLEAAAARDRAASRR